MTNKRSSSEQMACDDVFFSIILTTVGIYASVINYGESDWLGLFGTIVLTLFGLLWLGMRIYHLTHKDEIFDDMYSGPEEEDGSWAGEGWAERCGIKHGDRWDCPNCTAPGEFYLSEQHYVKMDNPIRWNNHYGRWECAECWLK